MNFFDAIIIYLACGAPFGVYYFLNNRNRQNRIYIRPILISLFWFPFAVGLLQKHINNKLPESLLSKKEFVKDEEINKIKKILEQIFLKNNFGVSIFEIKEILERYIGLTNALEYQEDTVNNDSHFFEIAGSGNTKLAAQCHQRRNRKLISYHQILAGQDFLKLVSEFVDKFSSIEEVEEISQKLFKLINDETTKKNLLKIFKAGKQSRIENNVKITGKELWTHDIPQQKHAQTLQISMNSATAKINLPTKN